MQGGYQYSLNKHRWSNFLCWDHQHLFTRHLEDCKNRKVRQKKMNGVEWGRSSCNSILPILSIFVCLFEFLCRIHDVIMATPIPINSSCKDKKKMGWIVSVLCIVQELCRFKVFIFHIRKSSTAIKDGKNKHTWDKNWHGEHQNSFSRHLKDSKKLG